MGAIMAAWKAHGKTGALLCCIWVNEQHGEEVTMSVCGACVHVRVHACICMCSTPEHSWLWTHRLQEAVGRVGVSDLADFRTHSRLLAALFIFLEFENIQMV